MKLNASASPPKFTTSDIPTMHAKLTDFLTTGELPPSSKERNLLLDLARCELSKNTNTPPHKNMVIFNKKQKAEHEKFITLKELEAKASAAGLSKTNELLVASGRQPITAAPPRANGKPPIHRAATTPTAKPATTGAFKPNARPTLAKADFDNLTPADKMRFSTTGGKLVEGAGNGLFQATIRPSMAKASFNAMTPSDRMRFCKSGGKLTA